MTPALQLVNNDTLVVSPSGLDSFALCPRYWWHRYGWRRVAAVPNEAAAAGKAFDQAMNLRYLSAGAGAVPPALEESMLAEVDRAFDGVAIPETEDRCTPARYKEVVRAYNEWYKDEPFDILAVQMSFEVELGDVEVGDQFWRLVVANCKHDWVWKLQNPLEEGESLYRCRLCGGESWGPNIRWSSDRSSPLIQYNRKLKVHLHGILDRLVYLRATKQVFILDTKTHKDFGPMQQASYDNHAQFKAYMWAVPQIAKQAQDKELTKDLPSELVAKMASLPTEVHGAIADVVIVRPNYKREASAGKSNAKPRNEFVRVTKFYQPHRLEEWRADTLFRIEQAMQMVARDHFPQNERACANVYGKTCPYMAVCAAPKEQHALALGSDEFVDYGGGPLGGAK